MLIVSNLRKYITLYNFYIHLKYLYYKYLCVRIILYVYKNQVLQVEIFE